MSIRAVDLDSDGDLDVVFSDRKGESTGVWWLEKIDGPEFFAKPVRLGFAGAEVMFLDIADLNGDKRLDIIASIRPDKMGVLLQVNSISDKWELKWQLPDLPLDRFGTVKAVRVADLDGDGRLDLAATCEHAEKALSGCFWLTLQLDSSGKPSVYQDIGGPEGVKFDRIELIDLDGDGDLDLMTCEERDNLGVFWYENPLGGN